jgi:hypothetical protein
MSFVSETALHPKTHNQPESGRLQSFLDRAQRLEADKKAISEDLKELWAEAKGRGLLAQDPESDPQGSGAGSGKA